jgi:predicted polyphosphate/ATP-dependent NAD kinase
MTRATNAREARFPALRFLDMPIAGDASDSALAARMMREIGIAAIVVLGGDGTHRVVAAECGDVPIAGVSSGTNNAFPETREPTVTGLAVGLAVNGATPPAIAFANNKRLDVSINGRREIALVDVAIVKEGFVGTRAIWKTDRLRELFVTFGEPNGIGLSSIVGLLAPVQRSEPFGRRVLLAPSDEAPFALQAPIAPGLIEPIGIVEVSTIPFEKPSRLSIAAGTIALDGEREVVFSEKDEVTVVLRAGAFRTIDVAACMAHAVAKGWFVAPSEQTPLAEYRKGG